MKIDIFLRDVIESDLPIFFEQQRVPESNAMAVFPAWDWDSFLHHWRKIMADETVTLKTILFAGWAAGNIVSWEVLGEREIGYWIGKEFWGRGIASESLRQFLGVVQNRPLFAHVAKHNVGSRRVLEKCGFKVVGEDRYVNIDRKEVEEFVLRLD